MAYSAAVQYQWRAVPEGRLGLLVLLAALLLLCQIFVGVEQTLANINGYTAFSTHAMLQALGMPAVLDATTVMHPSGFGYRIEHSCTALYPALIILAFLLVSPIRGRRVILGALCGAAFIVVVNSIRLIGLYYIGVNYTSQFDVAHDWIGQAMMVAAVLVFLVIWTRRPA